MSQGKMHSAPFHVETIRYKYAVEKHNEVFSEIAEPWVDWRDTQCLRSELLTAKQKNNNLRKEDFREPDLYTQYIEDVSKLRNLLAVYFISKNNTCEKTESLTPIRKMYSYILLKYFSDSIYFFESTEYDIIDLIRIAELYFKGDVSNTTISRFRCRYEDTIARKISSEMSSEFALIENRVKRMEQESNITKLLIKRREGYFGISEEDFSYCKCYEEYCNVVLEIQRTASKCFYNEITTQQDSSAFYNAMSIFFRKYLFDGKQLYYSSKYDFAIFSAFSRDVHYNKEKNLWEYVLKDQTQYRKLFEVEIANRILTNTIRTRETVDRNRQARQQTRREKQFKLKGSSAKHCVTPNLESQRHECNP